MNTHFKCVQGALVVGTGVVVISVPLGVRAIACNIPPALA